MGKPVRLIQPIQNLQLVALGETSVEKVGQLAQALEGQEVVNGLYRQFSCRDLVPPGKTALEIRLDLRGRDHDPRIKRQLGPLIGLEGGVALSGADPLASNITSWLAWNLQMVSDISAYGTDWGDCIMEDFRLIVVTEGNEDETEIHESEGRR